MVKGFCQGLVVVRFKGKDVPWGCVIILVMSNGVDYLALVFTLWILIP